MVLGFDELDYFDGIAKQNHTNRNKIVNKVKIKMIFRQDCRKPVSRPH